MQNNNNLKIAISKDFDKTKNLKIIKERIEENQKMKRKSNIWKWSLAPICLVAIICGILLVNNDKELKPNIYKPNIETKDNVNLYINDISEIVQGALKMDADVKITNIESVPYFKEIANIKIPSDLNEQKTYEIYVRSDRNSDEYNILHNYVFYYENSTSNRDINISFSKENKPIRDYYFSEEGSKESKINDIELKIYKYNDVYFTEFNYKGINFDIETGNITEQELTDLLVSIIK